MDVPVSIKLLIEWILNVGAARFSIWLMDRIKMPTWTYDYKTWIGMLIAAIVGLAAWAGGMLLGYIPVPGPVPHSWVACRPWIEGGGAIALAVAAGAKLWYGSIKAGRIAKGIDS